MLSESVTPTQLVLPLIFVLGGVVVGFIVERMIVSGLRKIAAKTKWKGDEIIADALQRATTLWFVLAGVYLATHSIPLNPPFPELIHKALLVIAIVSVTWTSAKIAASFVGLYAEKTEGVLPSTSIFANVTKLLVIGIGVLIMLQSLGVAITPLLTALGVGGLAVALALQETLSNLISGFHIIASRQIKPGDYIQLDTGEEGYVADITWRNTTIKALPNNMVVVPNSKLASAIVRNFSLPEQEMAVLVQVGVGYGSDLEKVEKVTINVAQEVMKEVQGGISGFEPLVRYHTFADSSIGFTVVMRAQEFSDQYVLKHEFIKRLHKCYQEKGIEIPYPVRTVHLKEEGKKVPILGGEES